MPTTSRPPRTMVRAALLIYERLAQVSPDQKRITLPTEAWNELGRNTRLLAHVVSHGWAAAQASLVADLDRSFRQLERDLNDLRTQLPARRTVGLLFSAREILSELMTLQDEFGDVKIDLQERTVSLLIDSIELESISLGAFRIVLHWDQIGREQAYQAIAESPHPPTGYEDVTHPHVRDEWLCEGDGRSAIKAALAQGRLLDFFTIVAQILQTYNPDSAHVALSRWEGTACRDCGDHLPADEGGSCERCEDPLCSDCSSHCAGCDRFICSDCASQCSDCGDCYCSHCLATTTNSGELVCETCLENRNEETYETEQDASDLETSPESDQRQVPLVSAETPADSLCLGEAPVPA